MIEAGVRAVVLDIEGTTGSADHVHEVLFPYARARLADWLVAHRDEPAWREILHETQVLASNRELDEHGVRATLAAWSDQDVKAPPLKRIQGLIWAEGYAAGTLSGHVYPDVPAALRRWRAAGVECHIYSSGSAAAQLNWFRHSGRGDLSRYLTRYFDLENAGGKRDPDAYRTISRTLRVPPRHTLFASDVREELDAAASADWQTVAVRRPGDPRGSTVPGHPTLRDLTGLDLHLPTP
ncbi:acireductone synthase [Streptomyces sp. NA04227]|uniref:acireductone synthase n=1 Tax=Streptomyces sp. NA04227 TaxID=2742136 RepID=UPI00158FEE47|nr:acireductone synthase [Streptomyces sp. NA04227]QKW10433.1 acireductone synthase [Streptomyces sp. NA04227]